MSHDEVVFHLSYQLILSAEHLSYFTTVFLPAPSSSALLMIAAATAAAAASSLAFVFSSLSLSIKG